MILTDGVVKGGLGFVEAPVMLADGRLLFVEIDKNQLSVLTTDGKVKVIAGPAVFTGKAAGPNGVAIGPDGAAYVCCNGGLFHFAQVPWSLDPDGPKEGDPKFMMPLPLGLSSQHTHGGGAILRIDLATGAATTLYEHTPALPIWAPDDIVFDAAGGFWFSDQGVPYADRIEMGGIFYAKPDGSSITRMGAIQSANGIGLSKDGSLLHVSDTVIGRLWTIALSAPGVIQHGPMGVLTMRSQALQGMQWVDSLKVEDGGFVCVATLLSGGITVFDPAKSVPPSKTSFPEEGVVDFIPMNDPFTTNLCFGGKDMLDVWITCAGSGEIRKVTWARPGLKLAH